MELLNINAARCDLCGECVENCPFDALQIESKSVKVKDGCRMCGVCVKLCPQKAIRAEEKEKSADKSAWRDILVYVEQENGAVHPVALELIGEAGKLAEKVGYGVSAVLVGDKDTWNNGESLLAYGVEKVYVYEHEQFSGFQADSYTNAVADCIEKMKPSVVLIGATAAGRSLAPRLSTRFRTGLTADCTKLEMKDNTDLVQIRPAFGGNIMAEILISETRPQFATVRYKVMDSAEKVAEPKGSLEKCRVTEEMVRSGQRILETRLIEKVKSIEEEEILVVAGRGVKDEKGIELLEKLTSILGGQLCYTRPMVEAGYGDTAHQIGLSGRTVKPKLIVTCGVSGAIQFASCMNGSECIVAINSDPDALIFNIANYCIVEDLYRLLPGLIGSLEKRKEAEDAVSIH